MKNFKSWALLLKSVGCLNRDVNVEKFNDNKSISLDLKFQVFAKRPQKRIHHHVNILIQIRSTAARDCETGTIVVAVIINLSLIARKTKIIDKRKE
jgi:hypothetical protein